jgi:hypothetical protein
MGKLREGSITSRGVTRLLSMVAYLVSLLLGEDPEDQDDDDSGFTSESSHRSKLTEGKTDGSPGVPSTGQRLSAAYAFGAAGLLLAIAVALVLPTFLSSACSSGRDCSRHLNMVKVVLILPGLMVSFVGLMVGAFQAYRAQSE